MHILNNTPLFLLYLQFLRTYLLLFVNDTNNLKQFFNKSYIPLEIDNFIKAVSFLFFFFLFFSFLYCTD